MPTSTSIARRVVAVTASAGVALALAGCASSSTESPGSRTTTLRSSLVLEDGWVTGSSVVVRRIRMDLDAWDRVARSSRENAIGRRLGTGGPVTGGGGEFAAPNFEARDEVGFTRIDLAAHIRRARATASHERFLRRPYSYDDGAGAVSDSGLVLIAYQADPVRQFLPVQTRLAEQDLMNLWTTPVGSAVFAVLPGPRPGEILGEAMVS
ncbi:MAG: Dyp-type peroxidase [Dermatophilaceae bacterium]